MADQVNTAIKGERVTKTYQTKDGIRTYKDVSYSFFANPMSGDVGKAIGPTAVKNSLLSILKTNYYERLFQPEFGSNIRQYLFEPMNPITAANIRTSIEDSVKAHEPRANVLHVEVTPEEDKNRYKVSIIFDLSTESAQQELETYFEKV